MVDWVSIAISISISSVSFIVAIIGLIISWRTYRTRFKPNLSLKHHIAFPQDFLLATNVKNIGNGSATYIKIEYHLKDKITTFQLPNLMAKEETTLTAGDADMPSLNTLEKIITYYKDINGRKHTQTWMNEEIFVEPVF
ncbi:MAG: hypothetical protein ACTSO7_12035 [Candidatus Heimdallarchaeota archaeon]